MRRCSAGTATPARVSVRTVSSRRMWPLSGGRSPEIRFTRVVLPLPERPKRAITPGVGAAKLADSEKAARCFSTDTSSMSVAEIAPHAPHQQLGGQQSQNAEREGEDGQSQRHSLTARQLHRGV